MAQDLTKGNPFKTIFKFSLPIIGGNLFQLFYTLADSIIVGQTLGADALAAVGSTTTVIYFVLCFIQGVTGGFGICLGHQFGKKDEKGMRSSIAASTLLCIAFAVIATVICGFVSHNILHRLNTPEKIYDMAYDYMFVMLMGTGATIFYNMISNMLRALGDSRTPLIFLVVSSVFNIVLDIIFIVPLKMGVAGAAWATVLSQLVSAVLSMAVGMRKFDVLRLEKDDFRLNGDVFINHLKIGFPMGFQMSVMCIGQLSMQGAVNGLGAEAIAGYTAATKVDQLSVLVNEAMGMTVSNFVAQNYGAGLVQRIRKGVADCLLLTSAINVVMCALILLCRQFVVPLFVSDPTVEITLHANQYLTVIAPFYLLLGVLIIYRASIQSMNNGVIPFIACIIELFARTGATTVLTARVGYLGVCLATPLAWCGACVLLVPAYWRIIHRYV